ncbi:MAG: Rpn family recombination-promoting nuclease/putative transposase, partial [Synergistaceae bacterium]|nr:Rpn family recombination-promoting nuclease/putative transposase [Synergistaceae bacterium]
MVFKRLFGDRRYVELLKDFLVATLDIPVCDYETVEIIDPQLKRERPGDKLGILDVLIKTKQGNFIDVEIQVDETNNMPERVTYYAAKLLASQLAAGQEYEQIKRVISVVILDYKLVKDSDDYHNRYLLFEAQNRSL